MFEKLKRLPELLGLAGAVCAGLLFFALTNPKTVPPAFFIVGFVILMVGLYCSLRLVERLSGLQGRLRPFTYNVMLFGGTLLMTMLLALRSIGQLDLKDVLILLVLFVGGYWYLNRLRGTG
jgi:hypothetical protein